MFSFSFHSLVSLLRFSLLVKNRQLFSISKTEARERERQLWARPPVFSEQTLSLRAKHCVWSPTNSLPPSPPPIPPNTFTEIFQNVNNCHTVTQPIIGGGGGEAPEAVMLFHFLFKGKCFLCCFCCCTLHGSTTFLIGAAGQGDFLPEPRMSNLVSQRAFTNTCSVL